LEQLGFSCGTVEGTAGSRTTKAISAYQSDRGLPTTGQLDAATLQSLHPPPEPLAGQELSFDDFALISPTPVLWKEKARCDFLGYNTALEMAAEKFHTTEAFLREVNPGTDWNVLRAGHRIWAPSIARVPSKAKAALVRIYLERCVIQALDAQGRIMLHAPCSIAEKVSKRPCGRLLVKTVIPEPDYTFNPAVLPEIAAREKITNKFVLAPGPNNPVGRAWIGLDLPGYGIHGTPLPEDISRTQSHGCFRLANWNALYLTRLLTVGTPVEVLP
jgi:lipoprotein-anchoring transpeptidase ErfK/SrfK